ncbi:MAG: hypothetical protein AAFQ32_04470 [Pseudomonadota bacterium]
MVDRDRLNHLSIKDAATATMGIIDRAQDYSPERQLIAITASFKLLTARLGIDPADAFTVADNIMNHADGRRVEFDAVAAYMEGEL